MQRQGYGEKYRVPRQRTHRPVEPGSQGHVHPGKPGHAQRGTQRGHGRVGGELWPLLQGQKQRNRPGDERQSADPSAHGGPPPPRRQRDEANERGHEEEFEGEHGGDEFVV